MSDKRFLKRAFVKSLFCRDFALCRRVGWPIFMIFLTASLHQVFFEVLPRGNHIHPNVPFWGMIFQPFAAHRRSLPVAVFFWVLKEFIVIASSHADRFCKNRTPKRIRAQSSSLTSFFSGLTTLDLLPFDLDAQSQQELSKFHNLFAHQPRGRIRFVHAFAPYV